ncbi:hypothetical protein [Leptolyngbya iicbica]|uniref:Uncharacterized protein n=1 Tax=Lyngbya confervoides BDU141951 TaxID=1574623 RepID=A0A8T6QNL4_9CYAN|nr:hypothetical protein [Leptolyngbya sp. LK]
MSRPRHGPLPHYHQDERDQFLTIFLLDAVEAELGLRSLLTQQSSRSHLHEHP